MSHKFSANKTPLPHHLQSLDWTTRANCFKSGLTCSRAALHEQLTKPTRRENLQLPSKKISQPDKHVKSELAEETAGSGERHRVVGGRGLAGTPSHQAGSVHISALLRLAVGAPVFPAQRLGWTGQGWAGWGRAGSEWRLRHLFLSHCRAAAVLEELVHHRRVGQR